MRPMGSPHEPQRSQRDRALYLRPIEPRGYGVTKQKLDPCRRAVAKERRRRASLSPARTDQPMELVTDEQDHITRC